MANAVGGLHDETGLVALDVDNGALAIAAGLLDPSDQAPRGLEGGRGVAGAARSGGGERAWLAECIEIAALYSVCTVIIEADDRGIGDRRGDADACDALPMRAIILIVDGGPLRRGLVRDADRRGDIRILGPVLPYARCRSAGGRALGGHAAVGGERGGQRVSIGAEDLPRRRVGALDSQPLDRASAVARLPDGSHALRGANPIVSV